MEGHAGQAVKLLGAAFGAATIANKTYVGVALNLLDGGTSYEQLATAALGAIGPTSHADVANLLWTNLFGAPPYQRTVFTGGRSDGRRTQSGRINGAGRR